jgi:hypothetical protein
MIFRFRGIYVEVWRDIPSLPDYQASSKGRVMRKPYEAPMPRGGTRTYGGQPHVGVWSEEDGRYVLCYIGKTYKVARLVCEAFNGPAPFPKAVVLHDDENSRNNRPGNLKWGTQKENLNAPKFIEHCRNRGAPFKSYRDKGLI